MSNEHNCIPPGWKLVPINPTHTMVGAGARAILEASERTPSLNSLDMVRAAYPAMLAIAPVASTEAAPKTAEPSNLAWLIERHCCEYERADPDAEDTICIAVGVLHEVVSRHVGEMLSETGALIYQFQTLDGFWRDCSEAAYHYARTNDSANVRIVRIERGSI